MRTAVPRLEALLAAEREHRTARFVDTLGDEHAVVDVDDVLPAAGRVEAADELRRRAEASVPNENSTLLR